MVRKVPLTQGFEAFIDNSDWLLVSQFSWSVKRNGNLNYAQARSRGRPITMHCLLSPAPSPLETNHKDGNGLNNCRSNLEHVTHSENQRYSCRVLGESGERNVEKRGEGFRVRVKVDGKLLDAGTYGTLKEAVQARDTFLAKHGLPPSAVRPRTFLMRVSNVL